MGRESHAGGSGIGYQGGSTSTPITPYTVPTELQDWFDTPTAGSKLSKVGSGGLKFDSGKTRWDLIPLDVMEGVAEVLTFGSNKYADNSWQGVETKRYYAAMMRHYKAMVVDGEEVDSESGLLHAHHFCCNAIFICWQLSQGKEENGN